MCARPGSPSPDARADASRHERSGLRYYLRRLGPGLITGAANDDPGAIGTHSQVGAQFGPASFWLAVYTLPLTAVVVEMCTQIGNVSGRGLITILRYHYPRWVLWGSVALFLGANALNLAADLGAMAEAVRLLAGGPALLWLVVVAVGSASVQVFTSYAVVARLLKVLALSLFAYVVSAIVVSPDWGEVLRASLVPGGRWDEAFLLGIVAVIGTRLSPYILVWAPSQVVEQEIGEGKTDLQDRMGATHRAVRATQLDAISGSVVANLVTWAILITSSETLHERGITNVATATEAAEALRPAAGDVAYLIFALGILATGLLAVPVLAGGIAYAVAEGFGWPRGLAGTLRERPRFYTVLLVAMLVAVGLNFLHANPIRVLVLSQVVNGLVAIPLLFVVLRVCNNRAVMGKHVNGPLANVLGWGAFLVIAGVGVASIWLMLR